MLKRQRLIQRIGKMNEWRCWFLSYWINLSSDTNNFADSLFINDMISPLIVTKLTHRCNKQDIWISFEPNGEKEDHYGRLLCFVWVSAGSDGYLCINEGKF